MNQLFFAFFAPRWNRYIIIGGLLTILGVILTPLIIGLPIMGVGFGLFSIGAMVSIVEKIPGGKRLVSEYERMFEGMYKFVRALIHEATH